MQLDLTQGAVTKKILLFAFPMICGNLLQQLYNVADTLIVGQFLGANVLAAVGSAYTLMTFLTSIVLGLCMGGGAVFSLRFGQQDWDRLRENSFAAFVLIAGISLLLNILVFALLDPILSWLSVPPEISPIMREYLWVIFFGIAATFLYNFFAFLLRAMGNSLVPLIFLGIAAIMNIVLDLLFVLQFHWGAAGAAAATVIAQWFSGLGCMLYTLLKCPQLRVSRRQMRLTWAGVSEIASASVLTCLQQSVMNLGILLVQGLINSFGSVVMAAFAAAAKIDSFAYMPLQDFGNAFSTFAAQNYGAKKQDRIRQGLRSAVCTLTLFSAAIALLVVFFARPLLLLFVRPEETEILAVGLSYLQVVAPFYFGIGGLFLLYGLYRAFQRPGMSLVLTICSLGTRVLLAYVLAPIPGIGVSGIWWAIPIGWLLADAVGILYYRKI